MDSRLVFLRPLGLRLFVVVWLLVLYRKHPRDEVADEVVRRYVESTRSINDSDDEEDNKTPPTGTRCQRRAIEVVRAHLGPLKCSEANRLVVGRKIREAMRDMGMRPSHIQYYAPVAVELYFIPTDQEVLADRIRHCSATKTRKNLIRGASVL